MEQLLLATLIVAATFSPLVLRSKKLAKPQLIVLIAALVYGMKAFTPLKALNSAPFHKFPDLMIALFTCKQVLADIDFCSPQDDACLCVNSNALATLAHCYETSFPAQADSLLAMCNTNYNTSLTRADYTAALLNYAAKSRPLDLEVPVEHPVQISQQKLDVYKAGYDQFLGNYNRSIEYGWGLVAFWAAVFAAAAVGNWTKLLFPAVVKTLTGSFSRAFRSRVSLPASCGKNKTNETHFLGFLDFLAPSRAETLMVLAFAALTLHLTLLNIHFVPNGPFFLTKAQAYCRYFAVRTGILGSYLLPLSVLFAGRNNVLQYVTRWEYSTFVMFHRWISRVMVALFLVHSVGYGYRIYREKNHIEIKPYIRFGAIAMYSGIAILVQALLVLRRRWYEAFLAIHIVLALAFMAGAWFHTEDLYFLWFYYLSVYLWALDRVLRVQRLCVFGFPVARVQLYEDNTLKFRVAVPASFEAVGGGHCFVHFLQWSCFWQSHPFTYTIVDGDIVFYVKVKEGVTRRLKRFLEANPNKCAYMRVAVEGSYGEATPAAKYDSSVFLVGGNGIPGIFAEAVKVPANRRVKLIWVVREYHTVLWFYEELMSLRQLGIAVEIYVTKPQTGFLANLSDKLALLQNTYTHSHYESISQAANPTSTLRREMAHVSFYAGRPNVRKIVEVHVEESPGSTCFVTCGHPVMVDDLRSEVARIVGGSTKRVDYFEQLQVWA